MNRESTEEEGQRLINKMAWISQVFGEVEAWLDSRPAVAPGSGPGRPLRQITPETLDLTIARQVT